MSSATLPQASAGAALLGRAVLVPLDDASRPVLRHRTFPARFCLYIENARAAVSFPARCVLQRVCCRNITAAGLKVETFVSLHLFSPWRQPQRVWRLLRPPIPARPNSSRWRKASIFRSGGIAPTATIGIVGAMTPPSALAQAASPGGRDSTLPQSLPRFSGKDGRTVTRRERRCD